MVKGLFIRLCIEIINSNVVDLVLRRSLSRLRFYCGKTLKKRNR